MTLRLAVETTSATWTASAVKVSSAFDCLTGLELSYYVGDWRSGSRLCWGATRRGIAGWRLTPMDREPIGTGRLPPPGGRGATISSKHRGRSPDPSKTP